MYLAFSNYKLTDDHCNSIRVVFRCFQNQAHPCSTFWVKISRPQGVRKAHRTFFLDQIGQDSGRRIWNDWRKSLKYDIVPQYLQHLVYYYFILWERSSALQGTMRLSGMTITLSLPFQNNVKDFFKDPEIKKGGTKTGLINEDTGINHIVQHKNPILKLFKHLDQLWSYISSFKRFVILGFSVLLGFCRTRAVGFQMHLKLWNHLEPVGIHSTLILCLGVSHAQE